MLGLASCQTEPEGLNVQVGDEVDATITVAVADVETRAGSNSAKGVFDNGILQGTATMRYVMEIYDEDGNRTDNRRVEYSDEKSVVFNVRLASNRDYTFVVWADVVDGEADVDKHYKTADLKNVEIINSAEHPWDAMDESRDAFTGVAEVDGFTSASQIQIPLTRPFAKLRVMTNDLADLARLGITPATATVTYTTNHRMAFNAFSGEACDPVENKNTITHEITYGEGAFANDNTLFTDYFFAAEDDIVNFTMDVYQVSNNESGRRLIKYNNFNTDIPVMPNHLTTISGNILTDGLGISVNVEESVEETELNYMEEQLRRLGKEGGELILNESVTISTPIIINEGVEATINLNGYNIINETNSLEYGEGEAIIVYGDLTINDEGAEPGTVEGSTRAVWARGANGKAVVTINGGIYRGCKEGYTGGGNSVIYASSGNTINIYGGTFEALAADTTSYADKTNGVYAALNVADNNGTINVYGGTFVKQNPAAPGTEPTAWNKAHPNGFVARSYKSALVEGSETDYEVNDATIIVEQEKLNGDKGILKTLKNTTEAEVFLKLTEDITPEYTIDVPAGTDVYLDLNGQTIKIDPETLTPNSNGSHYAFIIREGGSLTIDGNGAVEATTPAPIMFYPAGDLVIENGTFIRHVPEGYTGSVGSMFVGTKPAGGWESTGVTIKGGYFDCGYYVEVAGDIEDYMAGTKTLAETETDKEKRGQSGDANVIRKAIKDFISIALNSSNNAFNVYGGTFVGVNPAWGDEGCMLPTTPNYLRPWSYYQRGFIPGQEFHEDGIVLPEGFTITKGTHEDGRPTYTVTYNK